MTTSQKTKTATEALPEADTATPFFTDSQMAKITAYYKERGFTGDELTFQVQLFTECVEAVGELFGPAALMDELRSVGAE